MVIEQETKGSPSDSTGDIIIQESFRTPKRFECTPEHPQDEHIEQEMKRTTVEEHIGDYLPDLKFFDDFAGIQSEKQGKLFGQYMLKKKYDKIDNNEAPDNAAEEITASERPALIPVVGSHE
jgi:hypothetical protein